MSNVMTIVSLHKTEYETKYFLEGKGAQVSLRHWQRIRRQRFLSRFRQTLHSALHSPNYSRPTECTVEFH